MTLPGGTASVAIPPICDIPDEEHPMASFSAVMIAQGPIVTDARKSGGWIG